jgi:receptor protein-tyrosine kinase
MSIVEKAILRSQAERAKAAPAAPAAPAPSQAIPEPSRPEAPPPAVADAPPVLLRNQLALDQFPAVARDFRFLKRPVLARVFGQSRSGTRQGNLVMITSDLPQAGKSFVSLNLAGSMATERMMRVLLVDADPVRRTLSTRFGVQDRPGFLDLLAGDVQRVSDVMLATDVESLYFLPAGLARPDATELMASPRTAQVLKTLEDPNLIVLLDSPPLLLSSEGRVLADYVHHALVVVEAGRSTASEVGQVLDILKGSAAAVSMVLNKTPTPGAARHEEYYYAY